MTYTQSSVMLTHAGVVTDTSGVPINNVKVFGFVVFIPPKWYYSVLGDGYNFFIAADNTARITLKDGGVSGNIVYSEVITNTSGCTDSRQVNFGNNGIVFSGGVYLDGASTQLVSSITNSSLVVPVTANSTTNFATEGGLVIDSEILVYASKSSSDFSVFSSSSTGLTGRGYEFTAASGHSLGATVYQFLGFITLFYEQL